jgi:hypothetical protein
VRGLWKRRGFKNEGVAITPLPPDGHRAAMILPAKDVGLHHPLQEALDQAVV